LIKHQTKTKHSQKRHMSIAPNSGKLLWGVFPIGWVTRARE